MKMKPTGRYGEAAHLTRIVLRMLRPSQPGTLLILFLAIGATCFGGPKIAAVAPVNILDAHFVVVRVLREPAEIGALLACFERARKVKDSGARQDFSHKVDAGDRWLYDVARGELVLLSKTEQPVFQLSDEDREFVATLLKKKGPETGPDPMSSPPSPDASASVAPTTGAVQP